MKAAETKLSEVSQKNRARIEKARGELAKLEADVALTALARRFPNLELINDGERVGPLRRSRGFRCS